MSAGGDVPREHAAPVDDPRGNLVGADRAGTDAADGGVGAGGGSASGQPDPFGDEELHDLAAAYALDALDPGDEQAFVGHLATCPQCQEAVADFAEVAGHLGVLVAPLEPPAAVRESLLARALAEPPGSASPPSAQQVGRPVAAAGRTRTSVVAPSEPAGERGAPPRPVPASDRPSDDGVPGRPGPSAAPGSSADVADLDARRRRRSPGWLPWAVAAAAAAVAVVAGIGWVTSSQRTGTPPADIAATSVLDCVRDTACTAVTLRPTQAGTGAGVALVRGDSVSLVLTGVPANDTQTSTYVLWQQVSGGPLRSVDTFDVGSQVSVVPPEGRLLGGIGRTAFLAVSEESGRTAPAAPSTPLLAGQPPQPTA